MEKEEEIIPYCAFRTGLTFRDVYFELNLETQKVFEKEGRRMFITRHTVLGRWREIKKASYKAYLRAKFDGNRPLEILTLEASLDETKIPF